jgi:membrane protease YdiL (CAAX protease family)
MSELHSPPSTDSSNANNSPSNSASATSNAPAIPSSWSDLVIYLVGGFGLYAVATLIFALIFKQIDIFATFTLYLLNFCCLGGSVYLWGVRRGKTSWAKMGFFPPVWKSRWLWIALASSMLLIPVRGLLSLLAEYLLGGGTQGLQARMDIFTANSGFSWLNFGLSFLGIGIIAPISEELYFRGLLHGWFMGRFSLIPRVLLSATLFALAHYDTIPVAVSAFVLGAVNAVAYERSKSIWLPIAFHMIMNSLAVIVLYLGMLFLGTS